MKLAQDSKWKANRVKARPVTATATKGGKRVRSDCPVVGIGASAGGLEAFERLLRRLPNDLGVAYVLVQHLDPTHQSHLTEILSRATEMPVSEVRDGMSVAPNCVYIIPPNTNMALAGGCLQLVPRPSAMGQHLPIDFFFRSLAEAQKNRSIGVILSGTASDGAAGLKAIKVAGGITFAQDQQSAKYFGMPQSSIAAGAVDFILSPEGIAEELEKFGRHPYLRASLAEHPEPAKIDAVEDSAIKEILRILGSNFGVDFTLYKQSTLLRRIRRRMALHPTPTFKEYASYLQDEPIELRALYKDMFINVSGFFREPDAFERLKKAIFPALMKARQGDSALRVWVPGCSTGEEAFSLGIALLEFMHEHRSNARIQIFATDISEDTVQYARHGRYLPDVREQMDPKRLRRWFTKTDEGGYQVIKAVRDLVVFARHDLTKDPPFSRLDLISCRNLLIYLGQELQKKLIPIFHYALRPTGYLFLGAAESIGAFQDLFTLVDKKHKIYSKKAGLARHQFEAAADHFRLQPAGDAGGGKKPEHLKGIGDALKHAADMMLLNDFTPPSVLVNEDMEILQFRGRTGPFLEPASGAPTMNLLKMAREGLMPDIQSALAECRKKNTSVIREDVRVTQDHGFKDVNLHVTPVATPVTKVRCFLITFEAAAAPPTERMAKARVKRWTAARDSGSLERINLLKQELASNKAYLQSVINKEESANEELRSMNEEIMSANEELQSTSEELETANEELQSANEELTTLNEELANRNQELTRANNDVLNILASMNFSMIMLDLNLRIRRFTPSATALFNVLTTDTGRPIGDIRLRMTLPGLEKKINSVIESKTVVAEEVQDEGGKWYSIQIRPYLTAENVVDGAVIAIADVSTLVQRNIDLGAAIAERDDAANQLHEVQRRMLDAAISRERDALAREIHDTLSQVLAGVIVQLEAAEEFLVPGEEDLKRHVGKARDVAREGLEHARKTAWAWRSGESFRVGDLPKALEQLGARLFESTAITYHQKSANHRLVLTVPQAQGVLKVAQEAFANALLHSGATEVWTELRDEQSAAILSIRDNGKGFDLETTRKGSGFGLLSMEERIHQLEGKFRIETAAGRGTMIEATIPVGIPPGGGGKAASE